MSSPFMPIQPLNTQMTPMQPMKIGEGILAEPSSQTQGATPSFGQMFMKAVDGVGTQFNDAGQSINDLMTGKLNNLHDVMIEGEKAGIMLKLATHIASKVCTACTTLFQMQI